MTYNKFFIHTYRKLVDYKQISNAAFEVSQNALGKHSKMPYIIFFTINSKRNLVISDNIFVLCKKWVNLAYESDTIIAREILMLPLKKLLFM